MNLLQSAFNSVKLYTPQQKTEETGFLPVSVNYFPHRQCNYACEFCFHTTKNLYILPLEDAKRGMRLLADAGMKKLNISGGEPFLKPEFIGKIFRFCKEELHLESCSIVNNGSKVTEKWLDTYGQYLDVMAISCDSFDAEVNIKLGRSEKNGTAKHVGRVFQVADWCKQRGIKLKINSVITKLNWEEDMNASIEELDPVRWKVFQVLLLDSENTGTESGSLRDARDLVITDEQFQAFLDRHEGQKSLVPEDNKAMQDSYLLLDEELRFLNCEGGTKRPGRSVLKVGVQEALKDAGFDNIAFLDRGGIFDWTKEKTVEESLDW
ncbi:radical SAM enzyme [Ramaria rubella]|nr:radical SAM enzyme [Ramaria rubella]